MPSAHVPSRRFAHLDLVLCALATACSPSAERDESGHLDVAMRALPAVHAHLALTHPAKAPPKPDCPAEMVKIDGHCIDRFEAHIVEVIDGVEIVHPHNQPVCRDEAFAVTDGRWLQRTQRASGHKLERIEARSSADVYPQGYMSQVHAARACENAGKRFQ